MSDNNQMFHGRDGRLFGEKYRLESAMRAAPDDVALRDEYFSCLLKISNTHLGAVFASLPEIHTPIMFRSATSDVLNLTNVFSYAEKPSHFAYGLYGVAIPHPRTILDLGAYCGYSAIYFAHRFPDADIVCIEPPGANFEVLVANTAAYDNIRCIPAAIWAERAEISQSGHVSGDWGNLYGPANGEGPKIPGLTIDDVLEMVGWSAVDFIKCQVENAVIDVLCTGRRKWLDDVSCVTAMRPGGRWPRADGDAVLCQTFPDLQFRWLVEDNGLHIFTRSTARVPAETKARPVWLSPPSPEIRHITVTGVPVGEDGFYKFGRANMQLLPHSPGQPRSTVSLQVKLRGHSRFKSTIAAGTEPRTAVAFHVSIVDAVSGRSVLEAKKVLMSGETVDWSVGFGCVDGFHIVNLSTEMVGPGQATLARFHDPRLEADDGPGRSSTDDEGSILFVEKLFEVGRCEELAAILAKRHPRALDPEMILQLTRFAMDSDCFLPPDITLDSEDALFLANIIAVKQLTSQRADGAEARRSSSVIRVGREYDFLAANHGRSAGRWSSFQLLNYLTMQKIRPTHRAAVVTSMRDDGIVMLEWIAHYRALGFEAIFIYSNDNDDGSSDLLRRLAELGEITFLENDTSVNYEIKSSEHALQFLPELRQFEWVLFADSDEFLVPAAQFGIRIGNVLDQAENLFPCNRPGAILYNWKVYVSGNGYARQPGLLLERYSYSHTEEHVKSFARLGSIYSMRHNHVPELKPSEFCVDSALRPTCFPGLEGRMRPEYGGGQINHYWTRSFEEYSLKKARGDHAPAGLLRISQGIFTFF